MELELPSSTYTWVLNIAESQKAGTNWLWGHYYQSKMLLMFGFRWRLKFYPDVTDQNQALLILQLLTLPVGVSRIAINQTTSVKETGLRFSADDKVFEKDSMDWALWADDKMSLDAIKNINEFTFTIDVELNAVHDADNKDIIEQYLTDGIRKHDEQKRQHTDIESRFNLMSAQIRSLTETVQALQAQIDEEHKASDNNLQAQIDELTASVHQLMSRSDRKTNPKTYAFRNWIEHVVQLPEYFELFVENGVETLEVASMLTVTELSLIGIKKIGHKMQILTAVAALKEKANSGFALAKSEAEGGSTAYL